MRNLWLMWVCVFTAVSSGCSSARRHVRHDEKLLHKQASYDFGCAARHLQVMPYGALERREFLVQGCGKRAMYRETEMGLQLASPIENLAALPPQ
jgi:hypothetical protein